MCSSAQYYALDWLHRLSSAQTAFQHHPNIFPVFTRVQPDKSLISIQRTHTWIPLAYPPPSGRARGDGWNSHDVNVVLRWSVARAQTRCCALSGHTQTSFLLSFSCPAPLCTLSDLLSCTEAKRDRAAAGNDNDHLKQGRGGPAWWALR